MIIFTLPYTDLLKFNQYEIKLQIMLAQQNLMDECFQQKSPISAPVISRIENQTSRIKNYVNQLRTNKRRTWNQSGGTPFHLQNQCEISNIQPVSEKLERNSFELDLPGDSTVRKNVYTVIPDSLKSKSSDKQVGDRGLKYRPRGGINGRDDIRVRNLSELHKKIGIGRQKLKNQSNSVGNDSGNIEEGLLKFDQVENPQNPYNNYLQSKSRFRLTNQGKRTANSLTNSRVGQKQIQNSKKINSILQSHRKTLSNNEKLMIQPKQLHQYLRKYPNNKFPTADCSPSKIYEFFIAISSNFDIEREFNEPLIKRYRNCIYFGHKVPQNGRYMGFVWYFRKALYYGEFEKGRKNGYGIQIDLEDEQNECIWRGTFCNGKKTGYFQLISQKLQYNGSLVNSYFDGQGMLKTKGYSTYKGTFQAGMKHGFGVETFQNKKSLSYKGQYVENRFEGKGQLEGPNYYYKGSFRNGKSHGQGFERTNEFQYQGQFKNGKKSGLGRLKLRNGEHYSGRFENGELVQEYNDQQSSKKILPPQKSPSTSNQYIKNIKIQSHRKLEQQTSLSPSTLLTQEMRMQTPRSIREQNLKNQLMQRKQEKQYSQTMTTRMNHASNVNVDAYSSRIIPLEKHLSKRLTSLYEQNENEQGTIDNVIRYKNNQKQDQGYQKPRFFKMYEVENNEMKDMLSKITNKKNKNYSPPKITVNPNENQDDEEQPLQVKVLSRQ